MITCIEYSLKKGLKSSYLDTVKKKKKTMFWEISKFAGNETMIHLNVLLLTSIFTVVIGYY